jgi:quinol monooxygenase YgiN
MLTKKTLVLSFVALIFFPAITLNRDSVSLCPENYIELKTQQAGETEGTRLDGSLAQAEAGQETSEDEWLTAVTFIRGAVGKEEELKRELLSLTAPTRAEPGNIAYDLYQSPEKKNEFMRFEIWRNPEALEAHKMTPHIKASFERRQKQGWETEITLWKRVR